MSEPRQGAVPDEALRWGTGYGSRRHVVDPAPTIVRAFGRPREVTVALCSTPSMPTVLDFFSDQGGTSGRTVMALEPCKKCERARLRDRAKITEEEVR